MITQDNLEKQQELISRWDWILEGIDDEDSKLNTAIVLENSYTHLVGDNVIASDWLETLNEAPQRSSAVAPANDLIPKVLFPVIRRVYPSLIANKLVSVQPLSGPTGMIYYIIYTFSNEKGKINAGDEYTGVADQGLPAYATYYSSEKIGPYDVTVTAGGDSVDAGTDITNFLGTDTTAFKIKRAEVFKNGGRVSTTLIPLGDTANNFTGSANVGYDASNGTIHLRDQSNAASPWSTGDKLKVYLVYDQEGSDKIPDMEFSIGSDPVDVTERKLRVRWTKEAEQDMKAYHRIDVENELIKLASSSMNYEIDREILTFISDQVVPGLSFTHDWSADSTNNTTGNYLDRHRFLAQRIHMVSAKIAQYNRLGPATWAVVSPQVAAVLKMLPEFKGEIAGSNLNIQEAGQLANSITVYVDPNRTGTIASDILLGYKSTNSVYGAGVVYAPYVNWVSNLVTDPANFNSVRGFFSRYALHKVVRGQWHYGSITVENLGI